MSGNMTDLRDKDVKYKNETASANEPQPSNVRRSTLPQADHSLVTVNEGFVIKMLCRHRPAARVGIVDTVTLGKGGSIIWLTTGENQKVVKKNLTHARIFSAADVVSHM